MHEIEWNNLMKWKLAQTSILSYALKINDVYEDPPIKNIYKDGPLTLTVYRNTFEKLVGYSIRFTNKVNKSESLPRLTMFKHSVGASYVPMNLLRKIDSQLIIFYHDENIRILKCGSDKHPEFMLTIRFKSDE